MSVRFVSISGRASAEQSGFRGGRAWRTIARFAGVWGSLGDDGGQFAGDAGREVDERGEPAGEDGHERERQLAASGSSAPPGGEPGAGQERYAGHKRDGRPDQVLSLMNAPHHEMQRVRCAGQVENPCDDRQDADDRQEDGQRPPAGRRGCGMHVIHLLLCEMPGAAFGGGPATGPGALGVLRGGCPGGGRAGGSPAGGNPAAPAPGSRSSRRTRHVAAAAPSAWVPGPPAARSGHPRSCQPASPPPMPESAPAVGIALPGPLPCIRTYPASRRAGGLAACRRVVARLLGGPGQGLRIRSARSALTRRRAWEGRHTAAAHQPARPQDPAAVLAARRAACSAVTAASAATRAVSALV